MKNEVYYLMSQVQLTRFSVITKLIDGHITVKEAAESLDLSERQVKRLKKGVMQDGAAFLKHKNSDRKPQHAFSNEFVKNIINLKESDIYKNANFKHFQELLEEHEHISISYAALYEILKNAGIQSPKKRRRFKPHRRRKRKSQEGLLIQMDATPFEWFCTNDKFALHGGIDDATGKIVGLYMTKNECLHGYFEVVKQTICENGTPISIYADRHAIFLSQNASKLSIEDQLAGKIVNDTQFGRAMKELGITLIPARSAQAKGRVERLWETLQSRLPIEFKIAGVKTVDEANDFLSTYIDKFNQQFSIEPEDTESAYRALSPSIDLDNVLCVKIIRTIDNGAVFSLYNRSFKVLEDQTSDILPPRKSKVFVLINPIFGIKVQYEKTIFEVINYIKTSKVTESSKPKKKKSWTPPDSHYYKYGHTLMKKFNYEESDQEVLRILEDIFLKRYA